MTVAGGVLPVSVVAHFVHSDLERTGRLATSSDLVNRIVKAAEYSQLAAWMSLPTDCAPLFGPMFTISTALSWVCLGMHRPRVAPSPVCT